MSVILVGNGSSIIDKKNGVLIDSFNTVVRFNSYKTEGYELYTGTKTDVWFTVNKAHIKDINKYKEVYTHSWEKNENKCELNKCIRKYRHTEKINHDLILSMPIKAPSTGLIAIYYFIEKYGFVTITGFDWWDRDEHHYADEEVRGTLHKPKEEYKIIKQLQSENKIKFL